MPNVIELKNESGRLIQQARSEYLDKAEAEKRDMTADEEAKFDELHELAEKKLRLAERIEKQERAEAGFGDVPGSVAGEPMIEEQSDQQEDVENRSADAAVKFLRYGAYGVSPEERALLQMDNDIGGGYVSGTERFIKKVIQNMDNSVVIRDMATVYQGKRGETLGVPTLDTDVGAFTFDAGENTEAEVDSDMAFGMRELKPRDIKSKIIKISKHLLENEKIDIESLVAQRVAYQLSIAVEQAYMSGSGSGEPLGLFSASNDGIPTSRDVVTGSATNYTGNGLIDIQGTLKQPYQNSAKWLLNRTGLTKIRKLKDGNGQYLFVPGLQKGEANTILGKPYVLSEYAPNTFTDGNYVIMYGDFSYYWIADALNMRIQRLLEKYAEYGQVGLLFEKLAVDAMPVLAEAFVRGKCGA